MTIPTFRRQSIQSFTFHWQGQRWGDSLPRANTDLASGGMVLKPIGGVVLDPAGNFYGTTGLGGVYGNGTVFEEKRSGRNWTENLIYSFTGGSDAINPSIHQSINPSNPSIRRPGVSLDAHGNFFGTAPTGGACGNGAVFKLSRSNAG